MVCLAGTAGSAATDYEVFALYCLIVDCFTALILVGKNRQIPLESMFLQGAVPPAKWAIAPRSRCHPQLSIYASEFFYLLICLHRASMIARIVVMAHASLFVTTCTSLRLSSRIEALPLHHLINHVETL